MARPSSQATESGKGRAKQDASRGRVLEQRDDEVAVPVEAGGPADDWHQPVVARQVEKAIDVCIREPLRDSPQDELPAQLRADLISPRPLISGQAVGRQRVSSQRGTQGVGGQLGEVGQVADGVAYGPGLGRGDPVPVLDRDPLQRLIEELLFCYQV